MTHEHHHAHAHVHTLPQQESLNRAFLAGIGLNIVFVVAEFAAGFWFNSLALLSDAGHNLSDVVSLVLALLAFRLAKVKANEHYTYGYKKSTILVSLLNAVILLVAVGAILLESLHKLSRPQEVPGDAIAWVAGIGVLVNAATALLFLRERKRDLNVRGAFLHMAADALVSVGVLAGGIIIRYTGWYVIDPIIGIVVAVVILFSTWSLLHESIRLTLDGVPVGIHPAAVMKAIAGAPGVQSVHHIHIWAISTTENALTAHVVLNGQQEAEQVKHEIRHRMEHCNIRHVTLELETPGERCETVSDE
ncbi:MAG: cation diffusion facilitator family transporter [Prevotellaceae bacterium]|jgi:cobalt-zinc-cadmium efflux system protein|nr:cation diffusion facilitator family transporter [Prevotellaceae bacterium]